jgi:hypothetical protein
MYTALVMAYFFSERFIRTAVTPSFTSVSSRVVPHAGHTRRAAGVFTHAIGTASPYSALDR